MNELTRQRWLFGVLGIGALVVGLLELRNLRPDDRVTALIVLLLSIPVGFSVMWIRELYLRRTRKAPAGKPSGAGMSLIYVLALGAIVVVNLIDPILRVAIYGLLAGLFLGAFVYIRRDLERIGGRATEPVE